jgi:MATE family multidrug resistance protein
MICQFIKIALPSSITLVFSMLIELVNMYFIGHKNDPIKIAGVGLGNMYVNIICQSMILGLNGAVGTLASQAYGAKNLRKVGIYLNRGRFVAIIAFIPMTLLMLNCERVLLILRQEPKVAEYA